MAKKVVLFGGFLLMVWSFFVVGCPENISKNDAGTADKIRSEGGKEQIKEQIKSDDKVVLSPLDEALKEETRAGQIKKKTELITGLQAINKIGDWKIYNGKVAFSIHGISPSRSWAGRGGHIIDASVVDEKGRARYDLLEEVTPLFVYSGFRVIKATKIEVIERGGKGKRAVIRAYVTDVGVPILDQAIRSTKIGVAMEIDYILKPDVNYLEIITRVGDGRIQSLSLCDGLMFGCYTKVFTPNKSWGTKKLNGQKMPWLAAVGNNAAYLISTAKVDKSLTILIRQNTILPVMGEKLDEGIEKGLYKRYFFVTKGSLEEAQRSYRALHNIKRKYEIAGVIKGIKELASVGISLINADNKVISHTNTNTNAHGEFSFAISSEDYTHYTLLAEAEGHAPVKLAVTGKDKQTLTFQEGGRVIIDIKNKDFGGKLGGFIPARMDITGAENKLVDYVYPKQVILLRPGKYKIIVSHGFEYEYETLEFSLKSAETKNLSVTLELAVDSSGYVGGDMHLHASPSVDSDLPLRKRVAALVAEGLGFAASSDHDTSFDYMPLVKEMGLTQWIKTVGGEEVSPIMNHFNAYPVIRSAKDPLYFAIPWVVYKDGELERNLVAPEIWKFMREKYQAKIVQINHPRSSQGFFDTIKYDPKVGITGLAKGAFDTNWDCLEVYNSASGGDVFLKITLWDWFSLLNQGIFKTAVGNSDSHTARARPGMPRNMIAISHKKGEDLDLNEVLENLKKGHSQLYAGPLLHIRGNGNARPGDTVKSPKLELNIKVQAPSWISVTYVKIYANNKLLQQLDVKASKEHNRFEKTLTFEPKKDTWYVVIAGDDKGDMSPIYRGKHPISMTNPIYLDVDSNGFKAPGLHP